MECFRLLFDHLGWTEHQFLSGLRDSRKAGSLWGMMRGLGGVRKSIHERWLAKGLGLLCWCFKGGSGRDSVERGQLSSNRLSGISTGTIHQSTTPSLSQTIWPRWASTQFLSLPIVQTLLPVTFAYSLSSEVVVMRQLRWKRLCQKSLTRSHKRTSMGPYRSCWKGTEAYCSWRRFFRMAQEFHEYPINKSAHTKNVWKLIVCLSYIHRIRRF